MATTLPFGKSITIATCAQLTGRLANVVIPFAVITMAGTNALTDQFFFILAVAYYFYGILASAISQATIPLLVTRQISLSSGHLVACGLITAVVVLCATGAISRWLHWIPLPYVAAMGVLAGAGIANGLASGAWHCREKYVMPGITWALRLIPAAAWYLSGAGGHGLAWLAVGIGVADTIRCILLISALSPLHAGSVPMARNSVATVAATYGVFIVAMLINGLNPIIDRCIAGLGGPGSISLLETGERVYMMLAGVATIGLSTVLLPRLSRDAAQDTLDRTWPGVLKFALVWNVGWIVAGGLAGAVGFHWWANRLAGLPQTQTQVVQWVYWYYLSGLPFFTLALVYVKRLQAQRRYRVMLITASVTVTLNVPTSLVLFHWLGVPGIALATSMIHVLNCGILVAATRVGGKAQGTDPCKGRQPSAEADAPFPHQPIK